MSKEVAKRDARNMKFGGLTLTATGIVPGQRVSFADWEAAGAFIERANSGVQWWVGDWLLYGDGKPEWGDRYEQAISMFSREYGTLANLKSVSAKVQFSLRNENLSWEHHKVVSKLPPTEQKQWLNKAAPGPGEDRPRLSASQLRKEIHDHIKAKHLAQVAKNPHKPIVSLASWDDWLPQQPECDLLLTDPPYSTDVPDVHKFAAEWMPEALAKVKPTGRAYVCIGAYADEIDAYLSVDRAGMKLANILVWTYRNTLGPAPSDNYKLNWQAILYFVGKDAPPLDCPIMLEQFSVQDISAPDGRLMNREHEWQKPDELAERFIRHSTKPGDLVLDPFVCTGTFILAASKLGRIGKGCDISNENLEIAIKRGCIREE